MPSRRSLGTRRCITHERLSLGKIRQMLRPCRPRCKRRRPVSLSL
ncbi:TPA: potassium uptake protein Kup [Pseudomonas aeruginosa]|uniref:Potassium uptake protein Kup n=1 Tax=Pseudomonas aeruginosa TaxID=287 RepID=A0ABD7K073_PSEAI|nr:potassium uptake protein Kup [Pseudomonas aeruginosa]OPD67536.1 potassium uptake protein Kup [Pseudomonas paraeruginosa]OPD70301.1 potassium uptake protein Kup [Pseudomonas aeruginosa]OPD70863.1 potassium uptake protein Kup [Pseudomonas aeruginosa]OPD86993.1 potassium uptake protein Kup [Pseudomonas aeruginosa]